MHTYHLLLKEFLLLSISFLGKLEGGEIDSMKALKLLHENGGLSRDLIIFFDEMYLQKCAEYSGGNVIGMSEENEYYKYIVSFMVVGLKENISCVIKAITI